MQLATILTMLFTVGTVWGGFSFVLRKALKKEKEKQERGE